MPEYLEGNSTITGDLRINKVKNTHDWRLYAGKEFILNVSKEYSMYIL